MLGVFLARRTIATILRPIESVTGSVDAIGAGNLDQVVPAVSSDELGKLVTAVNTMARQLRDYRQTQNARLLRTQQAAQATIDSFPDPVLVLDREGLVEMANPAARRILGLGRATISRADHLAAAHSIARAADEGTKRNALSARRL